MGKTFGNLIHYRRMVYHGLSPFEQKAFTGAVGKGIPNLFRRMRVKVVQVVVPLSFCYYCYYWGKNKNIELFRKNPTDYENDV